MHDSSPHYFLFYYLIFGKFREFLEVPLSNSSSYSNKL
uniref:Uncharacterized protein n=1 Tax=Streptococcus suis TaxID=1307 RepID=A0A1X9I1G7_STRSU|nr:hypothetical protein [Streptococcus suis]